MDVEILNNRIEVVDETIIKIWLRMLIGPIYREARAKAAEREEKNQDYERHSEDRRRSSFLF
jgi:hypothetical protein